MRNFFNLSRQELAEACEGLGSLSIHADTIYRNLYKNGDLSPWHDPRLPKVLREGLGDGFDLTPLTIEREVMSLYDGSVKFLFSLADGLEIESVLMPETSRLTLCVSSQVGCQQGCVFCHTGRMGLKRNLSAGEIVAQVFSANQWLAAHKDWLVRNGLDPRMQVTNIVFMGMGEPLDNVDAVCGALDILTDSLGLAIGPRRISISTAGHLDGLKELTRRRPRVRLALSLHTPHEAKRSKLMPINRKWPIADVVAFLRDYATQAGIWILIQYTMIDGVNDTPDDARAVAELLEGLPAKVNLIPLNEVSVARMSAPNPERIQAFRDVLHKSGLRTMVRYSKGQDIGGACGQLVR